MKHYISAFLINALLLQLAGCYSEKEITYQEFYNLKNLDDAIIITNNDKSIKLTSDSLKNNYIKWNTAEDSIIVWSTRSVREQRSSKVISDTLKLASSEINKIYVDEFDGAKTFMAIAIPVVFVVILGFALASSFKLDWETSKSGSGF